MKRFEDWEWLDTWATLGLLAALCGLVIGIYTLQADHKIQYYYIELDSSYHLVPCVKAYRNWAPDDRVGCFSDIEKALAVMHQANAELRAGK